MYPKEIEKKLKKIFKLFTDKLLKKHKEMLGEAGRVKLSNKDKKEFLEKIKKLALEQANQTFDSWKTLSKEELARSDLTGAKKWIRKNYLLLEKIEKIIPEQLLKNREKEVIKTYNILNKSVGYRFNKLEIGKIGKGDLKKLIHEVKKIPNPNLKIKMMLEDLEKGIVPDQKSLSGLKEWINRRNELWARNETGNLQAANLKDLWIENDIEEYIWCSMHDGRTRESHLERNGKKYKVSDGLLPGEDYGCRCWAEPITSKGRKK